MWLRWENSCRRSTNPIKATIKGIEGIANLGK